MRCRTSNSRNAKLPSFMASFCAAILPTNSAATFRFRAAVLAKWDKETVHAPQLRPLLERILRYRQHVLAIFENLIGHDSANQKLQ